MLIGLCFLAFYSFYIMAFMRRRYAVFGFKEVSFKSDAKNVDAAAKGA